MILFLILVALGGHDQLDVLPKVWLKVHWKYRTEDLHLARSLTIDPLQAFVTYLLLDQQKLLSYNHTNAQHKINYVCNSQNQMFSAVNLRVKVMSFLAPQLLFDLRRGVRSDAQLSSTETRFQKCSQSGKNGSKHPMLSISMACNVISCKKI